MLKRKYDGKSDTFRKNLSSDCKSNHQTMTKKSVCQIRFD